MLCARNVGTFAGGVQCRRAMGIQRHAAEALIEAHMLEQNTASFITRAAATSSAFTVDCAVGPCSPTLKMIGALASVTMYDGVNLPWSR